MIFQLLYHVFSRSLVVLVVALLSVNYLPNKLFSDLPFEPRSTEAVDFDSVIPQEWNTKLTDTYQEYIQLNNILGPESIAQDKETNLLYTGLADGRLVELDPSKNYKLRQVLRFTQLPKCRDNLATRADECGRFLQVRHHNSTLYALEANTGLYKIDIKAGSKSFLGPKVGSKVNLFNGFTFDPKETDIVYVTISSTKWPLLRILYSLFELESSGQLVAFNIKTGKTVIVLENLEFINGIDVDINRDRLIFSESIAARISSLSLKEIRSAFASAKSGDKLPSGTIKKNVLIPVTPGNPDNIVIEGDIAYIALPIVKLNGKELIDHISTMPNVRKAFARFVYGSGKLIEYCVNNIFWHPLLEMAYLELKSAHFMYSVVSKGKSAVIQYNLATGSSQLLGTDSFSFLSEATPSASQKGHLFLGSFRSPFAVKVRIGK